MQDLAVTAIIPLYNGAEFIAQALESVLCQTMRPATITAADHSNG